VKIFVGNLPYSMDDGALGELFEQYGDVESATVVLDRESGRSRGFGFVVMPSDEDAKKAIEATNGTDVGGRPLTVNEAHNKRRDGGRRGGRGGGGNRRW